MLIRITKNFVERLNEETGLNWSYADFKKFYTEKVKPMEMERKMKLLKENMETEKIMQSVLEAKTPKKKK